MDLTGAVAHIDVEKTVTPASAQPGGDVTYTMTFTNNVWTNSTKVGSSIVDATVTYSNTTLNGVEL